MGKGLYIRIALSKFINMLLEGKVFILLCIISLGIYLRMWEIHHLFNPIHDYDEGVYSISGLFHSRGYLPYRDFLLVHPPLHTLTLSLIYRIFGYDFFYGRYLSIAISIASMYFIYLAGKRFYNTWTGLFASALFAVSPEMVYFGRRSVQESMGIFFVILAIYLASYLLEKKGNLWPFLCGIILGLSLTTKYLFASTIIAFLISIALVDKGERLWNSLKILGRASFWISYISISAIPFSLLIIIKWAGGIKLAIPFFDPFYISPINFVILLLVFIIPFLIALSLAYGSFYPKKGFWRKVVWGLKVNPHMWVFVSGILIGFTAITSSFLLQIPQKYIHATVIIQQNRPFHELPSLIAMMRLVGQSPPFLKMAILNIIIAIPVLIIILKKRPYFRSDHFIWVSMAVSIIMCQGFQPLPRYYISIFPFLFLGIAGIVPYERAKGKGLDNPISRLSISARFLLPISSFFLFLSETIVLLSNYTAHGVQPVKPEYAEENVYKETNGYLKRIGARKVYSVNPIFVALESNPNTTLNFDTYALIWLKKTPPEQLIKEMIREGVDHVILDSWVNHWTYPYDREAKLLSQSIRKYGDLVAIIAPDSACRTEIYRLKRILPFN